MTIYWNLAAIAEQMEQRGIRNRKHLSEMTGLSLPTAYALFDREKLGRIDVPTLEALMRAFGLDSPWGLLDYVPDE